MYKHPSSLTTGPAVASGDGSLNYYRGENLGGFSTYPPYKYITSFVILHRQLGDS